jgi:FKBP-type peptidyl-prolyl cis-trans isomerase SlyD
MSDLQKLKNVQHDLVVSMVYELTVEGKVLDGNDENDPLEFIQGHGHIVPGLEQQIEGMAIGETREIHVAAADGYGEYDPDDFADIPRADFPQDMVVMPGMEMMIEDESGEEFSGFVEEVTLDNVTLNFNHPLAGKDLDFKIKIVGLRFPTPEEIAHDHVHIGGHDHSNN